MKKMVDLLLLLTVLLLPVGTAHAVAITEDGTDQAVQDSFTFPPGFIAFPIKFRSDIGGFLSDGTELDDLLTVVFPGEIAKLSTGEGNSTVFQNGFKTGNKIDQITVNDPGLLGGTSDFVALYFDTVNKRFAVGFTSDCDSPCTLPAPSSFVSVPEPATALLFGTGLLGLGYGWRRKSRAV